MTIVIGYDCTHANLGRVPAGHQLAGYSTGLGPDIRWTAEDWAAHPGAIRIDQDAAASDGTADVLDVERGAATITEAAGWYRRAITSYADVARPGQRWPAIYTSASNVTPLVNALIASGVTSGPRLIVASWNLTEPQAVADVAAAAGPYPVEGVQFASGEYYDTDVWSSAWLASYHVPPPPPPPPPSWTTQAYTDALGIAAQASALAAAIRGHLP